MEKKITIDYISIGELAKQFGYNKSKLLYYVSIGLFQPVDILGKMMLFEKEKTIDRIKFIEKNKKSGMSLSDIKSLTK